MGIWPQNNAKTDHDQTKCIQLYLHTRPPPVPFLSDSLWISIEGQEQEEDLGWGPMMNREGVIGA